MTRFGLDEEILDRIVEIIKGNTSVNRLFLFGSRATGNFRDRSDIDLAVDSAEEVFFLRQELEEEVATLLKIDLVDLKKINEELKNEILKEGQILYEKA